MRSTYADTQNYVHPTRRLCRVCAANVRDAGIVGTGWLIGYNEAAQNFDFEKAKRLIAEAAAAQAYGEAVYNAAARFCEKAHYTEKARLHGEGQPRGEATDGAASENA